MEATKTTSARVELLAVNYLYPLPGIQQLLRLQKPDCRYEVWRIPAIFRSYGSWRELINGKQRSRRQVRFLRKRIIRQQLSCLFFTDLRLW